MSRSSRFPRLLPRLPRGDELYDLLVVDRHLAQLCERLQVLKFITPVNAREVRKAFLAGERSNDPDFTYRHEDQDFDALKSELHAVPIRSESELGHVFRRKRDELHDVLTMLQARGTSEFCERSRLLYGTTTKDELEAMSAWLDLPMDEPEAEQRSARDCAQFMRNQLGKQKLACNIRLRSGLSSSAAAGENSIAIRHDATFSPREMERIYVHEAETHILRFRNGERQPFRSLFYHGFPRHSDRAGNYLYTEEGLATLQEELAGVLNNDRRRLLALRATAVYKMDTEGLGFTDVFEFLRDEHHCDDDTAFSICERVFRGGGYTKDHIYYAGYITVRDAVMNGLVDLNLLFLGKVGLDWMDLVADLYRGGQGILCPPRYIPRWLRRITDARAEQALEVAGDGMGSEDEAAEGDGISALGIAASAAASNGTAGAGTPGSDSRVNLPVGGDALVITAGDLEWLSDHPSQSLRRAAIRSNEPEDESENLVS